MAIVRTGDFDALALFEAMDNQRKTRDMSWNQVAKEMDGMASELHARMAKAGRPHRPIAQSTLTGVKRRGDTTCQHAAAMLRWLDRSPESFMPDARKRDRALPRLGPDRKPRWNFPALADALDEARRAREITWRQLAEEIPCAAGQLTGLRRIRYAISMVLAMRITRWLDRPAADFIVGAEW